MGGADFIEILFAEFLRFDPTDPYWPERDRFFLDPGHMSPMLYATLAMYGHFSMDDLKNFRQWGSPTPGHPERDLSRGIENTSGPLGQGHTFAVGAAIAERFLAARFGAWSAHKTFAFISDGGIQEEISQGAGRIAGHLGLSNLILFYDANKIQLSTPVADATSEDTAAKYRAWNWKVIEIDGNDAGQIRQALTQATAETEKPVIIIGHTLMGKGIVDKDNKPFDNRPDVHGQPISAAGGNISATVRHLGGNPENPFAIFDDVKQYYEKIKVQKVAAAKKRKEEKRQWEKQNPELAKQLADFLSGNIPELETEKIEQPQNNSTRAASGNVLKYLQKRIPNLVVASADLSNSDKTDTFLKQTTAFRRGDFSGSFLQAGVSELTMAAIANGMALHGGIVPACATFLVFSDYMKPAIRLAALMELQVIYIFTHDAFRVGEDGPTHQPVEHEAQLRLLEQMRNHSHHRALLALRPADGDETTIAWKLALENTHSPTALILSRQNIPEILLSEGADRKQLAALTARGAYIIRGDYDKPDLIMLGNGSEVSLLAETAQKLEIDQNLKVRVVSIPSTGLFMDQPESYRHELLTPGIPLLALTAGLPAALPVAENKHTRILGMSQFGYSAPAKVLDQKFGFTVENVFAQAIDLLGR
jgi:transketolase